LPEELIKNLQGRYGLVWDGDALDTCSGLTGEYLTKSLKCAEEILQKRG
jgi:hypothetical protein